MDLVYQVHFFCTLAIHMNIDNKHDIGDTVYLVTDPEQQPHLVTELVVSPGRVDYRCSAWF